MEWDQARKDAKSLIHRNGFAAARKRIEVYLEAYGPDSQTSSMLADAAFMEDNPKLAYDSVVPLAAEVQWVPVLLRASLAASELGEVYPGQKEYCTKLIIFLDGTKQAPLLIPSGTSPRDVALVSLLALTMFGNSDDEEARLFYGLKALDLSPGNPLAASVVGPLLGHRGKFDQSIAILRSALSKAKGDMQIAIQSALNAEVAAKGNKK